jgi:hypothetical protein
MKGSERRTNMRTSFRWSGTARSSRGIRRAWRNAILGAFLAIAANQVCADDPPFTAVWTAVAATSCDPKLNGLGVQRRTLGQQHS